MWTREGVGSFRFWFVDPQNPKDPKSTMSGVTRKSHDLEAFHSHGQLGVTTKTAAV
jgi:hypothetical protein